MNENILAAVDESQLENEFEAACNDPASLDCGFQAQREANGFANFGFAPDKAAELREKELARIAKELEEEPIEYFDPDEDEEDDEDWDEAEDDGWEPLDDEDEEVDRFEESYGFDEDEGDEDNWE